MKRSRKASLIIQRGSFSQMGYPGTSRIINFSNILEMVSSEIPFPSRGISRDLLHVFYMKVGLKNRVRYWRAIG